MHKGGNLALKAKAVENEEESDVVESAPLWCQEEVKYAFHDYMALQANAFWKDPAKAKASTDQRNYNSGRRADGPRTRACYNCNDKYHFVVDCPYERREDHNGNLVRKDKSKATKKKPFIKKKVLQPEAAKGCVAHQTRRVHIRGRRRRR